ncbi:MAG TPA: SRPBCC domain-containing protein [Rhizomicrobium sp.]|jgi:uncharacterized protein YndB with AHSA1/START domain|nr:SRPBCC domain-containing protein [Rhizomicrobium sp.]
MSTAATKPIALEITRSFDAPVERVFDAWLSKSWGEWAGPPGVRGEVTVMEPHVGGRYRIVMHRSEGDPLVIGGIYREIVRPSRIVMSWKWEHEETDTLVTLAFRAMGSKTELHMRHEGFAAEARRDGHHAGWTGTLDRLGPYLAGQ